MQSQKLLSGLIASLRRADNERLLEAMAREINNHVFIRATFQSGAQELTSADMQIILTRYELVETTLALSERGHGPEAYAPKPSINTLKRPQPVQPLNEVNRPPSVDEVSRRILDGLEDELRSSRAAS